MPPAGCEEMLQLIVGLLRGCTQVFLYGIAWSYSVLSMALIIPAEFDVSFLCLLVCYSVTPAICIYSVLLTCMLENDLMSICFLFFFLYCSDLKIPKYNLFL